jgi:NADPH:quinone reductase-like Zn-dependent oxidoreductase
MGAEVTAVDGPHKANMLRRIGASHFIDYTREDFTKTGQAWDVILDMVARSSYTGCINALKPGGRYLMANPRISDMLRSVFTTRLTDKSAFFAFAGETEEELRLLREMIEAGEIKATIDRIYPMEQAAEAHRRVESEKRLGCVVISIQSV